MVFILQRGQPALLYLVPLTIIPTVLIGWRRNQLKLLWYGNKEHIEDREMMNSTANSENRNDSTISLLHDSNL
jgi:hypothetical protein